jgi:integrase
VVEAAGGMAQGDGTSMSKSEPSPKRAYGTGTVFIKGNRWYGRWYVDGVPVKRSLGPDKKLTGNPKGLTKKSAEAALRNKMLEYVAPSDHEVVTFGEAGAMAVTRLKTLGREKTTIEAYESTRRVHLDPAWRDRPVESITAEDIERLQAKMQRAGAKPKSVNNWIGIASAILNFAVKKRWRKDNPCEQVEPLKVPANERLRYFNYAQLDALIANVPDDDLGAMEADLYEFAAKTGLRRGECLGLRRENVKFDSEQVYVIDNFVRGEDKATKSNKPRWVPLSPSAAAAVRRQMDRSAFKAPRAYVWCNPSTGNAYDPSKLQKRFKKALTRGSIGEFRALTRKNGEVEMVPVFCFHDLRHTFGTSLAAGGRTAIQIKEYLGHSSLKTTEKYMHFAPVQGEAAQLEEAFALMAANGAPEAVEAAVAA